MAIGFVARGRIAWICSIVFGVILLIIGGLIAGAVIPGDSGLGTFLLVAGGGFTLFGGIFLILSLVSGGATD